MAEPFIGEIRMFSFGVIPPGWVPCNGQLLPINQHQPLFALLGTTFGGDGQTTFALPNLQGRLAIDVGNGVTLGATGGEMTHTLVTSEMPLHAHPAMASVTPAQEVPPGPGVVLAQSNPGPLYSALGTVTAMSSNATSAAGGAQPHENMMPYLTLSFCIAVNGIFPQHP